MKPRIGRNVVFVLLLAREKRNEVAEETGLSNASYSSVNGSQTIVHGVCDLRDMPTVVRTNSTGSVSHCSCFAGVKES